MAKRFMLVIYGDLCSKLLSLHDSGEDCQRKISFPVICR